MGSNIDDYYNFFLNGNLRIKSLLKQYFIAVTALTGLTENWENKPPSWVGTDPCSNWEGIRCSNSRVISMSVPRVCCTLSSLKFYLLLGKHDFFCSFCRF